jgi:hypothetical protein
MKTNDGTITADGKSAITQFLAALCQQQQALDESLDADWRALQILTAGPDARAAADQEFAEGKYWEFKGGCKATPLFDERDEKRAEWLTGRHEFSFAPAASRVQELLDAWGQRNDYAALDRLFQAALHESSRLQTAAITSTKLQAAIEAHRDLLDVARQLADDPLNASTRHPEWGAASERHMRAISELPKLCPPSEAGGEQTPAKLNEVVADLLFIYSDPKSARIGWNGVEYPVSHAWAEAFRMMVAAKGQPVGIGSGKPLRKPADDLVALKAVAPQLAELVVPGNRKNSGYRLTIFD